MRRQFNTALLILCWFGRVHVGVPARGIVAKTRAEILELFAEQIADWTSRFPAEAGVIRAKVCSALKFSNEEFKNWLATFRDKAAVAALEGSIQQALSQEETGESVIEGNSAAPTPTPQDTQAPAKSGMEETDEAPFFPADADDMYGADELPPELQGETEPELFNEPGEGTGWIDRVFPVVLSRVASKRGTERGIAIGKFFQEIARHSGGQSAAVEAMLRDEVCRRLPELKKADYERCMREARAALRAEKTESGDAGGATGDNSDWGGLAKQFLHELGDDRRLLYWRENWHEWTRERGCYKKQEDKWMKSEVTKWMMKHGHNIDLRGVANLLNAIEAVSFYRDLHPPCWLNDKEGNDKKRPASNLCLSLKNGILDLESVKWGMDEEFSHGPLIPHTWEFFTLNSLPYDFDPTAECPQMKAAIELWQPKNARDPEGLGQRLLQDFAGYIFEPGQPRQCMLCNVGPGGDGKSQLKEIYVALAGKENTTSLGLEALDPQQVNAREDLLGRTLWTIPDANQVDKLGEGTLKAITGDDDVAVHRKYKHVVNGPLQCKVVMNTNEIPTFRDRSQGIWRRLLLLNWEPVSKVVPQFAKKLIAEEMPGIFMWALYGWWRVRQQDFTKRGIIIENAQKARTETQGEFDFFEECCELSFDATDVGVSNNRLMHEYKKWCSQNNRTPFAHASTLGRALADWVRWSLQRAEPPYSIEWIKEFLQQENFNPKRLEEGKRKTRQYVYIKLLEQDEAERVELESGGVGKSIGKAMSAPYRYGQTVN